MSFGRPGLGLPVLLGLALLFCLSGHQAGAQPVIRDGGINPARLGKGDWIYFVRDATNRLGGSVPSVVNIPTLMAYYKSQGLQYVIVKAGTGSTNFHGGTGAPQFNSNLVHHAHAAGLLIFAYTRSYADDVQGEIDMAARCFALGADGWIIDAEAEWEASRTGSNGPALALLYGEGLRARFPTKFIAHAPFPIISYHSSFPYREFGYYCDAVMPQAYWTEIYDDSPTAVASMFSRMNQEYRDWQNSLSGIWTNAIKPIAPIAQAWSSSSGVTTGAEIDEFFDRLRTNSNPASVTGYGGISFWRADLKTPDMWSAIGTNILGDVPGLPNLTWQPESQTVHRGSNVTFAAWGTGSKPFSYRWRFNGAPLAGATSPFLTMTNVQPGQAGVYSVVVSNVSGAVASAEAVLTVVEPPTLFNVAAAVGARSAIVSWTSTQAGSSQVRFGPTAALGYATPTDSALVTNHSMILSGLLPGQKYYFSVLSQAGGTLHQSSGWTFETAGETILDNTNAAFTGTWISGTSSTDKYGQDYRYSSSVAGGSTASAIFTPQLNTAGRYDVFVWYPEGGNRTTNAPVIVNHDGGAILARVNQTSGGGAWRQVGTNLPFRSGTNGNARISNNSSESNKVVMADAVRFVYRVSQDTPMGPSVPDWWAHHFFGAPVDPQLDHDADGYPAWTEYLAGTAPNNPGSRLQFWCELTQPDRVAVHFSPYLTGRQYRIEEKTGDGPWLTLADATPLAAGNGAGLFQIPITLRQVRFYRLKIEWAP